MVQKGKGAKSKSTVKKGRPIVDLSKDILSDEEIIKHGGTPKKRGGKKPPVTPPVTPSTEDQSAAPKKGRKRKAAVTDDEPRKNPPKAPRRQSPEKRKMTVQELKKKKQDEEEEAKAEMEKQKQKKAKEGLKDLINELGPSEKMRYGTEKMDVVDLTVEVPPCEPPEFLGASEGAFANFTLPRGYNPMTVYRARNRPTAGRVEKAHLPSELMDDDAWYLQHAFFFCAENWGQFRIIVDNMPPLDNIPDQVIDFQLDTDYNDPIAQHVLPVADVPYEKPYAVKCRPDGDCLFNAISRLMYGTQSRAEELRVRMLFEAVRNEVWYLQHDYLVAGLKEWKKRFKEETDQASQIIRATGVYPNEGKFVELTPEQRQFWFRKELFGHRNTSEHSGLFILHVMSNVCRRPIVSVLPSCTSRENLSDLHRTVMPYFMEDRQRKPFYIMWSFGSVDGQFLNHFVPIVE